MSRQEFVCSPSKVLHRDHVDLADLFVKNGVEFMIIGAGASLIQGFQTSTLDIDFYFDKTKENSKKIIDSLLQFGLSLSEDNIRQIMAGKDFINLSDFIDVDIIFALDGFESYRDALKYKRVEAGIPYMDLDGVIISKQNANRRKDRQVLDDLRLFNAKRKGLLPESFKRMIFRLNSEGRYFEEFDGIDVQTYYRIFRSLGRPLRERVRRGLRGDRWFKK